MSGCIAISIGDITGIGPEVTLKALARELPADDCRYLLIGDSGCLKRLNQDLALGIPLQTYQKRDEHGRVFVLSSSAELSADLSPGSAVAARATLGWLEEGARRWLRCEADA